MKIKRIEVHNVMGVKDVVADLEGHHLWLVGGRNRSGKTSTLKAVVMALCGKRNCDYPDQPLKDGEKNGWVKVFTDQGLTIERKYSRNKGSVSEKLRVIDDEDNAMQDPQALLNKLYKSRGFDPLAFTQKKPKEQLEELKTLVGIDTRDIDELRESTYKERTAVNRELKQMEVRVKDQQKEFDAETPDERVDVGQLMNELKAIEQERQQEKELGDKAEEVRTRLDLKRDRIKELERQLVELQDKLANSQAEARSLHEEFVLAEKDHKEFEVRDPEPIQKQITEAAAINDKVAAKAQWRRMRNEVIELQEKSQSLTDAIKDIDETKEKMFQDAQWPIEGLSFDDQGIVYNGLPFSQCSAAESYDVSIAMGIAMNPELKCFIVQHGECMDNETLERIAKHATEKDYQLLVEFMTRDSDDEQRCQIVLEDGELKACPA